MKKSIRIAAALCAAVFMAGALAGGTFGGDKEKDGDGETGGGSGGSKVENRFVGKTIVYESIDDYYYSDTITFTTSTTGVWLSEYRRDSSSSNEHDEEVKEEMQFTYSLESVNSNNLLCMTIKNPTITIGNGSQEKEYTIDEYIEAFFIGISSETKALLRKQEAIHYFYYDFTDNNTVKIYSDHYYAGDMAKTETYFCNYDSTSSDDYIYVDIARSSVRLDSGQKDYMGIPQFSGNTFTAEMYRVEEIRNDSGSWIGDQYTSVGKITGSYAINGTGSRCKGTISFTKFPDEMKNLFDNTYRIQNWDPDKYSEYDDDKYREFKIIN